MTPQQILSILQSQRQGVPMQGAQPASGPDITSLLRSLLGSAGGASRAIGNMGGGSGWGTGASGLGLLGGLLGLGSGIARGDPWGATGGGLGALGSAGSLLSGLGMGGSLPTGFAPGIGALGGLLGLGSGIAHGNPLGIAGGAINTALSGAQLAAALSPEFASSLAGALGIGVDALSGTLGVAGAGAGLLLSGLMNDLVSQPAERRKNIYSEIGRDVRNVPVGMRQQEAAAQTQFTPDMSNEDLQRTWDTASQGLASGFPLADAFNKSGVKKMGIKFPDFSNAIAEHRALSPMYQLSNLRGQDMMQQRGLTSDWGRGEGAPSSLTWYMGPWSGIDFNQFTEPSFDTIDSVQVMRPSDPNNPYRWNPEMLGKLNAIPRGHEEAGIYQLLNSIGGDAFRNSPMGQMWAQTGGAPAGDPSWLTAGPIGVPSRPGSPPPIDFNFGGGGE